jgi:hypothetical protein
VIRDEDRMNQPVEFDRPLSQTEKDLMAWLAIKTVEAQMRWTEQRCADALDEAAAEGLAMVRWNAEGAWLLIGDRVLVHATREWLAFNAMWAQSCADGNPCGVPHEFEE